MGAVLWLRRDLRRADLPALVEAHAHGPVTPVFVIDPGLWDRVGPVRRAWVAANVLAAREAYGDLCVRMGEPAQVLPRLAREVGADEVHVSAETTPFGARRDRTVQRALDHEGVRWQATGSPYAVGPGVVRKGDGEPYRVFTPFRRAWSEHGWSEPASAPAGLRLQVPDSDVPAEHLLHKAVENAPITLPPAGEEAALRRWSDFLDEIVDYGSARDRPDFAGTSRLSPYLKAGAIHPRTLLADLSTRRSEGAATFRTELAWREFYADVLHHHPTSAWSDLRPELRRLAYDDPADVPDAVQAWREGLTGFPIVDAGMRQLRATGWMHNRVRMIVASFLTKDLHLWWPLGARYFLDHLIDGDVASNNHGWQWCAGTGTDASPYFRVFNPITQGEKFDPNGDYVRRWVPELAHLPGRAAHQPWKHGGVADYPDPILDHALERVEALVRYQAARGSD